MRLDHYAIRTNDRLRAVKFYQDAFGYKEQAVFQLNFDDGSVCDCTALEPPERDIDMSRLHVAPLIPWVHSYVDPTGNTEIEYHLAPEVFISEGQEGSIVANWVAKHGNGLHHQAFQCEDVQAIIDEWTKNEWAEFESDKPWVCDDGSVTQVFTKPHFLTGIVYEFIQRNERGFCEGNVRQLMESSIPQL